MGIFWLRLLRSPLTQPKKSKRTHFVENIRSVFVNAGQRRKRSIRNAKKVNVRNGSMQCLYAFMSTYSFFRSKSTKRTLGVRNVRSGFWSENLNMIEDTWQTQPTYLTYVAYDFMRKILWPKKQTGSNKYIVKVTH